MEVFHLETKQAIQHAKLIISYLRKKNDVSKMIQTLIINRLQLQAGTSWPVLSQNGNKVYMYVDPCYVSHTWAFLDSIGCHLGLDPTVWMQLQWNGDSFIMEDEARITGIKPINLVHVQCVQLHLGVTTKTNTISTNDGVALCDWALATNNNCCESAFLFPDKKDHNPME
jgi:hypothetical protein